MANEIPCPRCGKAVIPQSRYCEHCGVDLAVAAVIAEQAVTLAPKAPAGAPLAPELLVPRIGDTMLEQGLLQPIQLQQALEYQRERAAAGRPVLIGQALLELDLTTREVLDQVVTSQILKLQNALHESNQQLSRRVLERTAELQNALERLSELNYLKSNFIANISHELRTPLTHIKGYLDILSDGGLGSMTETQEEAIVVMKRAEERLEHLIEDLIQFSLASRGELSLNLQNLDPVQLIHNAIDRSQHKAKNQDVALAAFIPEKLPEIAADEEKINWALQHLLDNALKFTGRGGRVAVQAVAERGLVTIAVIDTGIGIPEDKIKDIFEPFHQLDGSTTRRYAGTGLGLAMVRRIIEAHGSQVRVKSALNKGSRFEFSIPAVR